MSDAKPATVYRHEFLICPCCGEESGQRVDHLYADRTMPVQFGSWPCDECGGWFSGRVFAPGSVEVWPTKEKPKKAGYALLRFDGKDGPVFFIMDCPRYRGGEETDRAQQESDRYLYEEHSCPTNWLRYCLEVVAGGATDPHGFLTFVRSVDAKPTDDPDDWALIFPEAFGPIEIDGTATEVRTLPRLK